MTHALNPLYKRGFTLLTAALLVTIAWLGSASATTLLKLDLETMTTKSEAIVQGKVTTMESRKVGGRIYTYITLDVHEMLKGGPEETITFRIMGGRVDGLVTIVHGTPNFSKDEEVVVFLERPLKDSPLVVTGMVQGKFHVTVGPDQSSRYVVPHVGNTPLVQPLEVKDRDGTIRRKLTEVEPDTLHSEVMDFEAFKLKVKSYSQDDAQ